MSYGEVMEAALASSFDWAQPWARSAKLVNCNIITVNSHTLLPLHRFFVNGTIVLLQMGICCIKYDFIVAHLREVLKSLPHPI